MTNQPTRPQPPVPADRPTTIPPERREPTPPRPGTPEPPAPQPSPPQRADETSFLNIRKADLDAQSWPERYREAVRKSGGEGST